MNPGLKRYIPTKRLSIRIECFPFYLLVTLAALISATASAKTCTYSTYKWNTELRKAVDFRQVKKQYSELSENEVDQDTGCSICSEDQTRLRIKGLPPVTVCKVIAPDIERALRSALRSGQPILELVGYRVGMTRGNIDHQGNRTEFSNHSFGTAIDINASYNGLYDNCLSFNYTCRLIKGGHWDPARPESIRHNSHLVLTMNRLGFKWGGKIAGKQKDFMHFSLSGY